MLATWGCTTFPKPTLSLDFLGATSLDSGITFSRGSQATLFDSTGTLVYAKHNLLLQSQALTTSPWITTNLSAVGSKTAPDGTATALEITATGTNGRTRQPVTVVAGQTYIHSMFVRRVTGSGNVTLAILDSGGTALFSTVLSLTSEWQRFTVSGAPAVTSILAGIIIATSTDSVEVWGAQLNLANMEGGVTSSLTTYYPTTTAAYYAPRFDYDPSTLQPRGLLIEEQRTNLLLQSEAFNTTWTTSNASITANSTTAPNATTTADTLVENASANFHFVSQTVSGTTNTNNYTMSCFFKASTRSAARIAIIEGTTFSRQVRASANLSAGTVVGDGLNGATLTAATIAPVGNDWYRVTVAGVLGGTDTNMFCAVYVGQNPSTFNYTGDGTSGIFIWGAQLEAGAFATSYIPTTTTALTRNADVASMTGTNFSSWFNASEGTFVSFAQMLSVSGAANRSMFDATDGSPNNRINGRLLTVIVTDQATIRSGGSTVFQQTSSNATTTAIKNFALAYKASDFAVTSNGSAPVTQLSGAVPTGVNQLQIGQLTGNLEFLCGYLRRITYYPTRLPNATLQALTL